MEETLETELTKIAAHVKRHRLESVAIFLLEAHLPLSNILYQTSHVLSPIGSLVSKKFSGFAEILSERKHIERLIELIETRPSTGNLEGRL